MWARQWGIQPSEFWDMTISEWWLEYDTHMKQFEQLNEPKKYAGKLKQADVDDLKAWMEKSDGRTRD